MINKEGSSIWKSAQGMEYHGSCHDLLSGETQLCDTLSAEEDEDNYLYIEQ